MWEYSYALLVQGNSYLYLSHLSFSKYEMKILAFSYV